MICKIIKIYIIISIILTIISETIFAQQIDKMQELKEIRNDNSKWVIYSKIKLDFVQKIGELDSKDDNYLFYWPLDIALDDVGNIYILDSGNYRIQKFDPSGGYLETFGRKGQGPGEFEIPRSLDIDSKGNMYISDRGNNCLIILDTKGKEQRRLRLGSKTLPVRINSKNEFVMGLLCLDGILMNYNKKFMIFDNNGNHLYNVGNISGNEVASAGWAPYFFRFAVDDEDNIYLAYNGINRIEKFDRNGRHIFTSYYPHKIIGTIPTTGIEVDSKNRIWVEIKINNEQILMIFNEIGILLGYITKPQQFGSLLSKIRIFGDKLFLIDFSEQLCVYEYKIVYKN